MQSRKSITTTPSHSGHQHRPTGFGTHSVVQTAVRSACSVVAMLIDPSINVTFHHRARYVISLGAYGASKLSQTEQTYRRDLFSCSSSALSAYLLFAHSRSQPTAMRQSRSKPRLISQPVLTSASNMLHDPRFGPGTQEPLSASLAAGRPRPVFNSKGLTVVIPAQRQSLLHVPLQASPSPVTPVSCAPHTMGDHTPNAQPHDHTPTAPCAASARTPRAPPKVLRHRPTTSLFESPSSPQPFKLRSAIKNRASHILKHTSIAPSVESEPEPELESRWSSSEDEDDVDDSDSGYAPSWLSRRRSISSRRAPTPSIRSQATSKTAKSSASIRSFCTRTISRSATPLPQIISSEIESPGGCPTTGRRSRRILGSIRNHLTPRKNR